MIQYLVFTGPEGTLNNQLLDVGYDYIALKTKYPDNHVIPTFMLKHK